MNDLVNRKKYLCFAYGQKPDTPQCTVFKLRDIEQQGGKFSRYTLVTGLAQNEAVQSKANRTTYKLTIPEGTRKISFPVVVSDSGEGGAIYDEEGRYLKGFSVRMSSLIALDGMPVVLDVPEGAKYLYFAVHTELIDEDYKIVCSFTDRIEDTENEWVHHAATCVGAFKLHSLRGKTGSGIERSSRNEPTIGNTYDQYKDIVNLAYAKYGTRGLQGKTGRNVSRDDWKHYEGGLIRSGLHDTFDNDGEEGYYAVDGDLRTWVGRDNSSKTMGYELLQAGFLPLLDGVRGGLPSGKHLHERSDGKDIFALTLSRGNGHRSICSVTRSDRDNSIRNITFGKYADLFPINGYHVQRYTGWDYYASRADTWVGFETPQFFFTVGHRYNALGFLNFIIKKRTDATELTARIMFSGRIVKMNNLQEYLNLPNSR